MMPAVSSPDLDCIVYWIVLYLYIFILRTHRFSKKSLGFYKSLISDLYVIIYR